MKVVAILQARMGSTRLPGKVLKPILGQPMLARILERVKRAQKVDDIVLATTERPDDDATADAARSAGVKVFRGSEDDVLDRVYRAAQAAGADIVVALTGDCALHDPVVIDEAVEHFVKENDLHAYAGTPANYPEGLDTDIFFFSALEDAHTHAKLPSEREHLAQYFKNNPERYHGLPWTVGTRDDSAMHWSVDTAADFEFVTRVYEKLYPANPQFTKNDILALLEREPELLEINKGGTGYEGLAKTKKKDEVWKVMRKLVLGTVELGMPYGLDSDIPQPTKEESFALLDAAYAGGITMFDTAFAYGSAEDVLGEWIESRKVSEKVKIISKLKPHALDQGNATEVVRSEIKKSLERLRVSHLDGYLLHTPEYVYRDDAIEALRAVKTEGLVKHIGVSTYEPEEDHEALKRELDYIQVPFNALDQRLDEDFFRRAQEQGTVVFARSPFLQGLLLMQPDSLPERVAHTRPHLEKFISTAQEFNLSQSQAALLFALHGCSAPYVVFGVKTLQQLNENLAAAALPVPAGFIEAMKKFGGTLERAIVNPSLWKR